MARKKRRKSPSLKILLFVIIVNVLIYSVFNADGFISKISNKTDDEEKNALVNVNTTLEDNLQVHVIDVGQGDCILISQNGKYILLDTGPNSSKEKVVSYIKSLGIKNIDYLILTHLHEDHIGGSASVIQNFDIGNILMYKGTASSRTYENLVLAAKEKKYTFYAPTKGEKFDLGDATFTILSDGGENESENANDRSIVIRLEYKQNSFLFMADAEEKLELDIMSENLDIKSDVIKIGHHGSSTSTTSAFLSKVSPKYAIISLGMNNAYGFPCKSVMRLLRKNEIEVYRTDENSDIVIKSDGQNITFNVQKGTYTYISAN